MSVPNKIASFLNKSEKDADTTMLLDLQRETFDFFLKEVNPHTGLIIDKTQPGSPSSIAVVGMAISSYVVGVERHLLPKADAIKRILKILHFFYTSHQGEEPDASGYKGFYYHFLDMHTGKRAWESELSTIDTAILMAGILSASCYFNGASDEENEIRRLADFLYTRVDWQWALNGGNTITHGWKPECGFLRYRWATGYNEAHILYILAMASPTFPIDPTGYHEWTSTFELKTAYGRDYIYAGPLFIHQFSHLWIDFRGIQDDVMRKAGFDYFENSRRATCIHREYAIENPKGFSHYGPNNWGFTASDGPGNSILDIDGKTRVFYDYIARGAPFGPDDGTIAPWGVVASLPFAPGEVVDTIHHAIERLNLKHHRLYGFDASFNPTYPEKTTNVNGWVSHWQFGLNQGPIVMMIENYHTELIWKIMRNCPHIIEGLRKAGFSGGWLDAVKK
jgi:hypothetical protein